MTAGAGILLIAALSALVAVVGPAGLLTGSGTAGTVDDIVASPAGSSSASPPCSWWPSWTWWSRGRLFHLFATSNRGLAGLAAGARAAYAALFALAIAQLLGVSSDLGGRVRPRTRLGPRRPQGSPTSGHCGSRRSSSSASTSCSSAGSAYTSRLVPRVVAVLVALAGLGYLVDSIATWLVSDYTFSVGALTAVGELLLGIWLLAKGFSGRTGPTPSRVEITTPERAPSSR